MLFPIALTLTVALAGPAQSPSDSLILTQEFNSRFEFARVELAAGKVYRVEIRGAHQIEIVPIESGTQNPRIFRQLGAEAASHTIEISIEPLVSGVYQIHVLPTSSADAPLRVYLDSRASTRRERVRADSN